MPKHHKPIIAKFANGLLTCDGIEKIQLINPTSSLDEEFNDDSISVHVDKIAYSGKKLNPNTTQCVVFVWDHEHNQYQSHIANMYTLIPDIYSTLEKVSDPTKINESATAVEMFGSTKIKKSSKIKKKQIDISAASANTMKESLPQLISSYQDSITQFIDDQAKNKSDSIILPPRNPNASSNYEIYNIKSILPKKIKKHLISTIDEYRKWLVDCLKEDVSSLPAFVHQIVRVIPDLNQLDDTDFFILLIYWYYLYEFYVAIKKKAHVSYVQKKLSEQIPKKVLKYFIREFTSEGGTINNLLLTKCLCYLTLIALYVSKFTMDCLPLAKDLGVPIERLKNILKEIGCDISDSSSVNTLPLNKKRKRKNSNANDSSLFSTEIDNSSSTNLNRRLIATLRVKNKSNSTITNDVKSK